MTLDEFKKRVKKIPDTPGVYFFLDSKKKVLYIGKATSLSDRMRSYFVADIAQVRSQLIGQMVDKAKYLDWRQTDSVLEALILEANLIRTNKPHYNTALRDDKSFNYVVITKEDFPRILVSRGKTIDVDIPVETRAHTFGPFPHGMQLREAMRIIRKIFPYRDQKCTPPQEKKNTKDSPLQYKGLSFVRSNGYKPCFNRHIGLCPGVCTGEISKIDYAKIIRRIVLLFEGKKSTLIKSLQRDMKCAAKDEAFEEASRLKRQLFALNHIQDVSLIKDEYRSPSTIGNNRIEAYDVAHLAGSAAVGVMTVVEEGIIQKAEYRKFKIKTAKAGDDPGSLKEILSRRLGHTEWPLPRVIVVDGATAQINIAENILKELGIGIPVVGVVKDERHRPRELRGSQETIVGREKDILLANAEAHRYAIEYHRRKSRKEMFL